jgi:hypothetical protein
MAEIEIKEVGIDQYEIRKTDGVHTTHGLLTRKHLRFLNA